MIKDKLKSWFKGIDGGDFVIPLFISILLGGIFSRLVVIENSATIGLLVFINFSLFLHLMSLVSGCEFRGVATSFLTLVSLTGLFFLINWSLFWTLWIIPIILILVELFFWIDSEKPKATDNKFWFTAKKKLESLVEAVLALLGLNAIAEAILKLRNYWDTILKWIGYIGAGAMAIALVLLVLYIYIRLNSIKYRDIKFRKKKK